jgi:hypothetical protein
MILIIPYTVQVFEIQFDINRSLCVTEYSSNQFQGSDQLGCDVCGMLLVWEKVRVHTGFLELSLKECHYFEA